MPALLGSNLNRHPEGEGSRSDVLHQPDLGVVPGTGQSSEEGDGVGRVREEVEDGDAGSRKDRKSVLSSEEGPVRVSEEGERSGRKKEKSGGREEEVLLRMGEELCGGDSEVEEAED